MGLFLNPRTIRFMRIGIFFLLFFALEISNAQIDTTRTDFQDTASVNGAANRLPVFTTSAGDLDADMESQDVSSVLQSSRDVFTATAGFSFSNARFRIRGYSSEYQSVFINGINVNNSETGFASWSAWGGLNDVTRFMEVRTGIAASRVAFGNVGGYANIETSASSYKKGSRFSYALSNRMYRHRAMFTHSTGLMENGWAITASGSVRYANQGYLPGTSFEAFSYYLSVDKKLNDKHLLSLVGFGSPIKQGRMGFATQEAMNLAGTNYYNPFWGYQDGVVRNSRISNTHKPMIMLSHVYSMGGHGKITTSLYSSFGRGGVTNLNWYDAKNPTPDYYRYLPSYFKDNPAAFASQTALWENDVNVRQINWDQLYFANSKNLFYATNVNGIAGNNVTGKRAKYIVEENRNDSREFGFNVIYNKRFGKMFVSAGANGSIYRSHNYKVMNDLLGADFWLDYDQFAPETADNIDAAQNNLDNPNRLIKVGDKFGYDYFLNMSNAEVWAQAEYSIKKFDFYAGATVSSNAFWRTGNIRNGKFPQDSKGDSEKKQFLNYGVKGGATYKLTGRHYFSLNGMFNTRPPDARNSFISPRTRNDFVNNLKSEEILSADVNYLIRFPNLKARFTYYHTQIKNITYMRTYFHDDFNSFVNFAMTGLNQLNQGVEIGVQGTVFTSFTLSGVLAYGQNLYTSRPLAEITRDNSDQMLASNRVIYLKNYHVGNTPEFASNFAIKYSGKKFWWVSAGINYYQNAWVEVNPDRRTEEALKKYFAEDPQVSKILDQQKLPSNYTIDISGGKSFKVMKKYYLNVNATVNNLLNNTNFITGGNEQLRYDATNIDKFPTKYSYALGLNYFLMIGFSF